MYHMLGQRILLKGQLTIPTVPPTLFPFPSTQHYILSETRQINLLVSICRKNVHHY